MENLREIKEHIKKQSMAYFNSPINVNTRVITHDLRDVGLDFLCCYDIEEDKYQGFALQENPKGEMKSYNHNGVDFNYIEQAVFETSSPFYPIEEKLMDLKNIGIKDVLSISNADLIAWYMQRLDLSRIMDKSKLELIDSEVIDGSLYNLYRDKDSNNRIFNTLTFIEYWCPTSGRHYIQPSQFETVKEHMIMMNAGIDFAKERIAFQI